MPDLNSLPPSSHSSYNPTEDPSPSPRSASTSTSLAATATINAGIQNQSSRRSSTSSNRNRGSPAVGRSERRRSIAMNLNFNDPALPGPGELQTGDSRLSQGFRTASPQSLSRSPTVGTGDPHHHRAPSLGELHQELEQEQEAQVNRLLQTIRLQQQQLQQLQQTQQPLQQQSGQANTPSAIEDTPTSERSLSFAMNSNTRARSPAPARASGRDSPFVRPISATQYHHPEDMALSSSASVARDETAFYQAEAQMLTRENQMLRQRIRELERQANEARSASLSLNTNAPTAPSNLVTQQPLAAAAGTAPTSADGGGASSTIEEDK